MSNNTSSKIPWVIAILAIAVAIYFALIKSSSEFIPPSKVDIPQELKNITEFAIFIGNDKNNTVFVVNSNGEKLKACKTCNEELEHKYGLGCKNAPPELNICGPLKPVVPMGTNGSITYMHFRGSDCWLVVPSLDELIGIPEGCTINH